MNGKYGGWIQTVATIVTLGALVVGFFASMKADVAVLKNDMQSVKQSIGRLERDLYQPRTGG